MHRISLKNCLTYHSVNRSEFKTNKNRLQKISNKSYHNTDNIM